MAPPPSSPQALTDHAGYVDPSSREPQRRGTGMWCHAWLPTPLPPPGVRLQVHGGAPLGHSSPPLGPSPSCLPSPAGASSRQPWSTPQGSCLPSGPRPGVILGSPTKARRWFAALVLDGECGRSPLGQWPSMFVTGKFVGRPDLLVRNVGWAQPGLRDRVAGGASCCECRRAAFGAPILQLSHLL